jgi:hypothetical protein
MAWFQALLLLLVILYIADEMVVGGGALRLRSVVRPSQILYIWGIHRSRDERAMGIWVFG